MTIDLADIARGRRITAVTARELALCKRHARPTLSLFYRTLRRLSALV